VRVHTANGRALRNAYIGRGNLKLFTAKELRGNATTSQVGRIVNFHDVLFLSSPHCYCLYHQVSLSSFAIQSFSSTGNRDTLVGKILCFFKRTEAEGCLFIFHVDYDRL